MLEPRIRSQIMNVMFQFPEIGKDCSPGYNLPACPRIGEEVAFSDITYVVKRVVHQPGYLADEKQIIAHLEIKPES